MDSRSLVADAALVASLGLVTESETGLETHLNRTHSSYPSSQEMPQESNSSSDYFVLPK